MSFIDTDDPFSIAAKRIRSSVIRSTPEPQLPIQGKQQPTTYIIEPDLMESQTGKMNLPNDVAFDDAGFAYNTVTGNPVQIVRRPNVLPIAKTPDGLMPVMPKMLDAASNIVGGVAAPAVATKAGEVVLGSGTVRKSLDESLITKAKEHFGITREPKEAGYVLPDGSMLDLSGRHYATGYENINGRFVPKAGQPDYLKGTRSVDHREVADITDVGGTEGMRQFMNKTGAIRNQPGNGIDTTVIPTDQQLNRLISSHNSSYRGEPFTVDISNPITGENIASKTFEKPNVEKIKKWIADETAKYPTLYSDTRNQVYSQIGHQFEKNQPFYSALERTVDNAKIGKADANQWLGYLKNQPGVKQEELQYVLGNLPEGQISKQALSDIIKNNKIELKEVVKGGPTNKDNIAPDAIAQEKYKDAFQAYNDKINELTDNGKNYKAFDTNEVKALESEREGLHELMVNETIERMGGLREPTKYHNYQLPGGERYQEMLLTTPVKLSPKTKEGLELTKRMNEGEFNSLNDSERKVLFKKRDDLLREGKIEEGKPYKSSHWDEPNILAHVRYNDRNIPDVGKSLHLEEIQSDWHQAGRKQGYKDKPLTDPRPKFKELENKLNEIDMKYPYNGEIAFNTYLNNLPENVRADYQTTSSQISSMRNDVDKYEAYIRNASADERVPDAPFKKNWDELAFKRMLHKAANEGYDSISWTPGEAQAARYDLSKQVSKVILNNPVWHGENDIRGHLIATSKANGNDIISKPVSSFKEIEDLIGKEAAEKLVNKPSSMQGRDHILDGDGLKVGGEGMKSFYDKMLVDKASSLIKKYGGKVEKKNVNGVEIPYIKLTPELKEKAKAGFPLFSSVPITVPVSHNPFASEEKKSYTLVPVNGNPFQ